ncbi:pescadillo homolog [Trichomonascus vanleenenianus]|uniref:mRNA-binding ribosome synthesis protein NOP7 n=1 Tax=Trichomonascus vanleenenianus TaxID=2268995 RepID=UPI003EC9D209
MGKIKKKHTSGAAKNYITRTQAVKKLQVSLADFRRLCIFKGIYPREPKNKKKANKGSTAPTTFYYSKDIQYLMHDPILQKFREHKAFAKKLNRALGRGEVGDAKRLDENRPRYKLDHVIKERYPTFLDALRDIDDPLCMLFLFAAMPATDKISYRITQDAEKLCNQWMAYVSRERLLTKVFVSIKGVYYEAVVRGQPIMWIVPFRFPQNIPSDIDFRVMCTFLEFYTTLLHFVLYRLYSEAGLVYPPTINKEKLKGVGGITAYVLESRAGTGPEKLVASASDEVQEVKLDKAVAADNQNDESEDEEDEGEPEDKLDEFTALPQTETAASDVLAQPKAVETKLGNLFSGFTFFIGRETPLDVLEFIITGFGGRFISEAALDELIDNEDETVSNDAEKALAGVDLSSVTHQITDRPAISHKIPGRTYIQPQWIFDSINKGSLVPVAEYAPGATLPPHLSPWGDAGGYDPEAELSEASDEEEEEEEEEIEGEELPDEEDEEDAESLEHQRELEKEAAGVKYSESAAPQKKSKKRKTKPEDEEKELKKMMMSNKTKKLYNKMQYGIEKKEARMDTLKAKKRKLEDKKKQLNK